MRSFVFTSRTSSTATTISSDFIQPSDICRQPKTIIFWGQGDIFFTPAGGEAFLQVLPKAEMHRLQSGHFALEDCLVYIADHMLKFYQNFVEAKR